MRTAVSRLVVWGLFGLFLIAPLSCKSFGNPDPSWQGEGEAKVLRVRWIKSLVPELPNFMIPEIAEEHDRFNPVETGSAGFDTDMRRAFIGASAGGLYCLDVRSGKTVWRFDVDDPVGSVPLYDSSRKTVFFGADDGKFYALQARSGRKLWALDTGAEIRRKALLVNDTLYVINADNTIFALDPESGETVWQYRRAPLKGFSGAGHSAMVFAKNKIIAGFSDGYIVALDPLVGAAVWTQDLAASLDSEDDEIVRLVDADATPVVVGDILVGASVDGGLQGINVDTGNVEWTNLNVTSVTGLATNGEWVYAARSAFGLTAIKPSTGEEVWSERFQAGNLLDPVVYDDVLLLSDSIFGLSAVSSVDGHLLQRLNPSTGFFARPSIYAGYLLVIGNGGTLFAMSVL